jgi:hypothetical protein
MKVFGRVFILRRVATTDMTARHAEPEVYPSIADFQTIFTPAAVRRDLLNLVGMCASSHLQNVHHRMMFIIGIP